MDNNKINDAVRLVGADGLSVIVNANGSVGRMECGDTSVNLFPGNELEGGPANLYLRCHGSTAGMEFTPLLGPRSPTRSRLRGAENLWVGAGTWQAIRYTVTLTLSRSAPAWFWHVNIENASEGPRNLDLIYVQDIALAPYATVRLNEYYVSQYVDHTALAHAELGWVVASRQNLAVANRNPWCVTGSLRRGRAFATDALQVHGLASRSGGRPEGIAAGLSARRLQHEHSMVAIQDEPLRLEPDSRATLGFFALLVHDHPDATSAADLSHVGRALLLAEAVSAPAPIDTCVHPGQNEDIDAPTLFSTARLVEVLDLKAAELRSMFPGKWRHRELDAQQRLLSFFHGTAQHVVMKEKELHTLRPHGHLLRTGRHATPDESALTSTTWMAGVFHSMLTQGHVSFNRFLSTVHSYLGLFRSHGQRVFVEIAGGWQLLDVPSAFEMSPQSCRWIYRDAHALIDVRSEARSEPHEMLLMINILAGGPRRCMVTHHVALGGDDGSAPASPSWESDGESITVRPAADSEAGRRFPEGSFRIAALPGTAFEKVGGDELLFVDGRSRQQPYICVILAPGSAVGLRLQGDLVREGRDVPSASVATALSSVRIVAPKESSLAAAVARLTDIAPWFTHNALIHYLSPRGLEQYCGGGWGTRDVTQGPVELLLALGETAPVRDLLMRVMSAQSPEGDWPQWFMFFERERSVRAGDSHGDIVFWPILALAQYLVASGDAELLQQSVPFFAADSSNAETATVWQHVERALALIGRRIIAGTSLAAYGHGDWNDALQPADPAMREHMCSAWTVTLHHQTLVTLAQALRLIGRAAEATALETAAEGVLRDFQRLLLADDVLTGYALFDGGDIRYLLHPRDDTSGVRYSALAMIHAILGDMLTPAQAQQHLRLIEQCLSGPDGVRLFDRPMPYRGGPQKFFQRAESAAFFGREIGLMYMHAHLRYAQALAHVGDAERFFHALCQANPIAIRSIVPSATLRQANCYYSSSDAAFADRYQASEQYDAAIRGETPLDGGWRVYSSGAGIALALIVRRFLGLSQETGSLHIDPVIPAALNGLQVEMQLLGRPFEITYQVNGAGHGVTAAHLNGVALILAYEHNPHRKGAARVSRDQLAQLQAEANTLRISIG